MAIPTESGVQSYSQLKLSFIRHDLRNDQLIVGSDPDEQYTAASLSKLYIGAAALSLNEKGEIDLQYPLKITTDEYFHAFRGTGYLGRVLLPFALISRISGKEVIPPLPAEGLVRLMIRHSDNLAAYKIANFTGRDKIQEVMDSWGLRSSSIFDEERDHPNVTTASDMDRFLAGLGKGYFLEEPTTLRMISWMRRKHLPNREYGATPVLYKEGSISERGLSFFHQAGYILGSNSRYSFVVLTSDQTTRETTYPQQEALRNRLAELAVGIV